MKEMRGQCSNYKCKARTHESPPSPCPILLLCSFPKIVDILMFRFFYFFLIQVDAFQEMELIGAALQGLLLDFRLWSDCGVEAQALLLEGVSSVVRALWFAAAAAAAAVSVLFVCFLWRCVLTLLNDQMRTAFRSTACMLCYVSVRLIYSV